MFLSCGLALFVVCFKAFNQVVHLQLTAIEIFFVFMHCIKVQKVYNVTFCLLLLARQCAVPKAGYRNGSYLSVCVCVSVSMPPMQWPGAGQVPPAPPSGGSSTGQGQ